ncbi:MAG: 50S ribosomal protein P1 [Candidatus Methylarchaceae archaeon HK02M2]|nr:50S ribosomal protein P1 [Candidatus Methylarchaceae archaeon HK02M2]
MEYVYAALLLHKLGKEINEENIKNVVKATGVEPDEIKAKALISALSEINIEDALKGAPTTIVSPATTTPVEATEEKKKPEKKEEEKEKEEEKKEEESLEGLSALFG